MIEQEIIDRAKNMPMNLSEMIRKVYIWTDDAQDIVNEFGNDDVTATYEDLDDSLSRVIKWATLARAKIIVEQEP